MTTKRFKLRLSKLGDGMITDTQKREDLFFDKEFLDATLPKATEWLNALNDEGEQLKQDNAGLMKLLENQSIIIQELHSKILEFELKKPITLTKKDLELMGKAISYYTHGRCGE